MILLFQPYHVKSIRNYCNIYSTPATLAEPPQPPWLNLPSYEKSSTFRKYAFVL
ncbi:hypothetical protein Hanom_Chr12g01133211 [Helianthus anomalus]